MNLYHISQDEFSGYDTYSDAVVCAPDEQTARNMDPRTGKPIRSGQREYYWDEWCSSPEMVTVKFLGKADSTVQPGVVCASYHAG